MQVRTGGCMAGLVRTQRSRPGEEEGLQTPPGPGCCVREQHGASRGRKHLLSAVQVGAVLAHLPGLPLRQGSILWAGQTWTAESLWSLGCWGRVLGPDRKIEMRQEEGTPMQALL